MLSVLMEPSRVVDKYSQYCTGKRPQIRIKTSLINGVGFLVTRFEWPDTPILHFPTFLASHWESNLTEILLGEHHYLFIV